MDYKKIYDRFIDSRKLKEAELISSGDYKERHHIIPSYLGGSNKKDNLIYMSGRDHVFAHLLLGAIYGGRMWFALDMILGRAKKISRVPSREEVRAAVFARKMKSKEMKANPPMSNPEIRTKVSKALKGRPQPDGHVERVAATKSTPEWKAAHDGKKHHLYKHEVINFSNADGREFKGTRREFIDFSGVSASAVSGMIYGYGKTSRGWLVGTIEDAKNYVPAYRTVSIKHDVFTFIHDSGIKEVCTRLELRKKYNLKAPLVSDLVNGRRPKAYGWRVEARQ
jgi:hypothetical protein